ncbi:MAG: MarR family transcriptional regulator [Propionibacterium sp.]|nr:MarR family transcriptional regulator [Propionibacterium sp.]
MLDEQGRPIGYWLKLVDHLLDAAFLETLGESGLSRRHWQILNLIGSGSRTVEETDIALAPFLGVRGASAPFLDDLQRIGWIEVTEQQVSMTPDGQAASTEIRANVDRQRERVATGISDEAWHTTLSTLQAMAANLGWTGRESPAS